MDSYLCAEVHYSYRLLITHIFILKSYELLKKDLQSNTDSDINSLFTVQNFISCVESLQKNNILNNEPIKSMCLELLEKQPFNALGVIAQFAKEHKISWLHLETIEKV